MITEKRNALRSLIESSDGVHFTAYLVNNGDPNDLRAQLTDTLKAVAKNIRTVMSRAERTRFLRPIRAILDDARVLRTLRGNVGIFRTANSFRVLHVPVEVEKMCSVATTFHVKPLLRWLQSDRDFLLIGVENGAVHLYQGSQHSLKHIDTLTFSRKMTDEASMGERLVFWKRSSPTNEIKVEIVQWLEERLSTYCKNSKPKLFFAGRKSITDAIKFELSYRSIAKRPTWNSFKPKQLGKICTEIRSLVASDAEKFLERSFIEFHHANNLDLTESNLFTIAKAAVQGRVKRLMIAGEVNLFGKLNRTTGDLVLHTADLDHEDDCLLDDLAQTVLAHGGKVVVSPKSDMPGGYAALAITDPQDPEMPIKKSIPQVSNARWQPHGASA